MSEEEPELTPAGAHAASVARGVSESKVLLQQEWFVCPAWAAKPRSGAHLQVYKSGALVDRVLMDLSPYYMLGRNAEVVDVHLEHPSVSRHHCVFVYHCKGTVYVIDLASGHGVYVNGSRIPSKQTIRVRETDEVRIGASTRVYRVSSAAPRVAAGERAPRRPAMDLPPAKKPRVEAGDGLRCLHLLLKHTDSRKPVSWRDPKQPVSRTKQEAIERLQSLRAELSASPSLRDAFGAAAAELSDCASAKRQGDLGVLKPGQMLSAFEEAARALKPGGMSEPVSTESGVHLILRVAA
eukprot:TRINITY_DN40783_c0_g1_i1.p1 TRINITY_DN40783_c0_g1~~TRINITY_DN40783_c0_g1_i1.p1  ORF type:complete len:318 (+),score=80.63 TRINITY_DN40783_c0_g1_i1:70-954(+)